MKKNLLEGLGGVRSPGDDLEFEQYGSGNVSASSRPEGVAQSGEENDEQSARMARRNKAWMEYLEGHATPLDEVIEDLSQSE